MSLWAFFGICTYIYNYICIYLSLYTHICIYIHLYAHEWCACAQAYAWAAGHGIDSDDDVVASGRTLCPLVERLTRRASAHIDDLCEDV